MTAYPKPKTIRNPAYLLWLRLQRCCSCGATGNTVQDIVPCHTGGGVALKGSDLDALPLCTKHHAEEHRGDKTFWAKVEAITGKSRDQFVKEHRDRYELHTHK